MLLRIKYATDDSVKVFSADTALREEEGQLRSLPQYLLAAPLESLARRWWLLQGNDPREDANAILCADFPGWSEATLSDLQNGYSVKSPDAVCVFAIVERVKRACSMLLHSLGYERFLWETARRNCEFIQLSLNPDTQPAGTPLPTLPKSIIDAANAL